jgi:argininosuccinate synthase
MNLEGMKVVLAYSGGLDTSVAIKWLQEKYNAEVITVTVNVGQGDSLEEIEARALKIGASRHYSIDARMEFIDGYVYPAIRANALYEGKYPVSSALSRPLIASKLIEVASKENADAVAHGCTGKGNDQVRFEVTLKALNPAIKIIAPVREWGLTRSSELEYARVKGIPVKVKTNPYSIDQNLWGRSIECGPIENPEAEPPEDAFEWTLNPEKAPNTPEYVTIGFKNGVPVEVNGESMDSASLINYLNIVAGRHGVGRIDHIEDRLVGIKSREVYECPAAVTIIEAHRDLEKMVLTRNELMFKQIVEQWWTYLVYTGLWVEPLRLDLESFINETQKRVDGEVKVKLFKGLAIVTGRSSPYSIYDLKLSTYEEWSTFNQSYAKGFIELWGLQSVASYQLLKR